MRIRHTWKFLAKYSKFSSDIRPPPLQENPCTIIKNSRDGRISSLPNKNQTKNWSKTKEIVLPKVSRWIFSLPTHFLPLFRYEITKFFFGKGSIPQSLQSFLQQHSSKKKWMNTDARYSSCFTKYRTHWIKQVKLLLQLKNHENTQFVSTNFIHFTEQEEHLVFWNWTIIGDIYTIL